MDDILYINIIDSDKKIPFILTYGIFKELQVYLNQEGNLFNLFTDSLVAETVIKIALSSRDDTGRITEEFSDYKVIKADDIIKLLDLIFDYFENFFYLHQQKVLNLTQKLEKMNLLEQ